MTTVSTSALPAALADGWDLPFDLVELVPCARPSAPAAAPLREVGYSGNAWLPEEMDRLSAMFRGDEDLDGIATALGRSLGAVRDKLGDLGLRRSSRRSWTELEDDYLGQHYGREPSSSTAGALGRSVLAVRARAGILGLTEAPGLPYTFWEMAQIRAGYSRGVPLTRLAIIVGRPVGGIVGVAARLGITHANKSPDWTDAEQARALVLAEEGHRYVDISAQLAKEGFPDRGGSRAIGPCLRKVGYSRGWGRPWTPEEEDLLRAAYTRSDSLAPLQALLCRSETSIRWKAGDLGLRGTHTRPNGWRTEPSWKGWEDLYLKRHYGKTPIPEIARFLQRPKAGVYNRANKLGLKTDWCHAWTSDEDLAIGLAYDHGLSMTDLALAFDRDVAVVSKRAIKLGKPFAQRSVKAPRGPRGSRPTWTLASILQLANQARAA